MDFDFPQVGLGGLLRKEETLNISLPGKLVLPPSMIHDSKENPYRSLDLDLLEDLDQKVGLDPGILRGKYFLFLH